MWPRLEHRPTTRPVPLGQHDTELRPHPAPIRPTALPVHDDCTHGKPGGDRLSGMGVLTCPLCRKDDHLSGVTS